MLHMCTVSLSSGCTTSAGLGCDIGDLGNLHILLRCTTPRWT